MRICEYLCGRITVVYHQIRDKESGREGSRPTSEPHQQELLCLFPWEILVTWFRWSSSRALCPLYSQFQFLREIIWLAQIKSTGPLSTSKDKIRWYRNGPWKTPLCLQSWSHKRENGWGGCAFRSVSPTAKNCSRSFTYVIVFNLHYQIISQLKKPGY